MKLCCYTFIEPVFFLSQATLFWVQHMVYQLHQWYGHYQSCPTVCFRSATCVIAQYTMVKKYNYFLHCVCFMNQNIGVENYNTTFGISGCSSLVWKLRKDLALEKLYNIIKNLKKRFILCNKKAVLYSKFQICGKCKRPVCGGEKI